MRSRVWRLIGVVVGAAATLGSCVGALVGHYAVSSGLHINGWQVPQHGTETQIAQLPAPMTAVPSAFQADFPDDTPPPRYSALAAHEPAVSDHDTTVDEEPTLYSDVGSMQSDAYLQDPFDVADPLD